MSLVGTRPILQDELLKYELHHRARIALYCFTVNGKRLLMEKHIAP